MWAANSYQRAEPAVLGWRVECALVSPGADVQGALLGLASWRGHLVPLQKLGRYIGFGVLGSLLLGFGVVFLGMAGLRALQDETGDTFSGDWSWVPYLIMFVALLFGAGLVWVARTARRAEKEYG